MKKSINVILTTIGRPIIKRMLKSIVPQLEEQDYLTIVSDVKSLGSNLDWAYKNCRGTLILIRNATRLGHGGHVSRTKWQQSLPGDYHMHADDDDVYEADALHWVRVHCTERKLYLFRIVWAGGVLWKERAVKAGNISTQNGVFPPIPGLPEWEKRRGGDGLFYERLAQMLPVEFVDRVIYRIHDFRGPPTNPISRSWFRGVSAGKRIRARAKAGAINFVAKWLPSVTPQTDRRGRPVV